MTLLKSLLSELFLLFEKWKGRKTVYEVKLPKIAKGRLTAFAVDDYEIRIYCQKKQYKRRYDSWLVPDKNMAVYRVFSVVSSDAPLRIQDACELDVDIPGQLSPLIEDEMQEKAAIQAYLDLLVSRLADGPSTPAA